MVKRALRQGILWCLRNEHPEHMLRQHSDEAALIQQNAAQRNIFEHEMYKPAGLPHICLLLAHFLQHSFALLCSLKLRGGVVPIAAALALDDFLARLQRLVCACLQGSMCAGEAEALKLLARFFT